MVKNDNKYYETKGRVFSQRTYFSFLFLLEHLSEDVKNEEYYTNGCRMEAILFSVRPHGGCDGW